MQNPPRKALFLDRDGVINVDHGYVSTIEAFEFSEGIVPLMRLFHHAGYLLYVVTNQSGIGRGYYRESDFAHLTEWMVTELQNEGIPIEQVAYCPHTPEAGCSCRKPRTGMIDTILAQRLLDLKHSWLIGDKESDMQLAHQAGIGQTIFIGGKPPADTSYAFESVAECAHFFQENQDKIELSKEEGAEDAIYR
jgi:D-glycero-D-manno-heptose 1,7-bisphosphate phosphatase